MKKFTRKKKKSGFVPVPGNKTIKAKGLTTIPDKQRKMNYVKVGLQNPVNLHETDEFGFRYGKTETILIEVNSAKYRIHSLVDDSLRIVKFDGVDGSGLIVKPSVSNVIVIK